MIEWHWKDNIFTGLVRKNRTYFIIYGRSTAPNINLEKESINEIISSTSGEITTRLLAKDGILFYMLVLESKEEYYTAERIIRAIIGEQNGRKE